MAKKAAVASIDMEELAEKQTASPHDLAQLDALADELCQLEKDLQVLADRSRVMLERYNQIQLELLPDLMTSIGVSELKRTSGEFIKVRDFVRASIPTATAIEKADGEEKAILEERRKKAFLWLRKNDADSLIKNELVAEFGKDQDADAKAWYSRLLKKGYRVKCEESVNFQTLNAFIRERIAAGENVPSEPFSLFVGKKAEVYKKR